MRAYVLSNGSLFLCFDRYGQVRDFYFPQVGRENHIGAGLVHKIGVWVDGACSWLDDGTWEVTCDYRRETLVGDVTAHHEELGVTLTFADAVYNERNAFVRLVTVHNRHNRARTIKVFFNQQFHISESPHGDTAYYCPGLEAVIHYKGRRLFLISGQSGEKGLSGYSVGLMGIEGREGTWVDAQDGELAGNPIEHGTVDSVVSFARSIGAESTAQLSYWVVAATTFSEAAELHRVIQKKTPAHIERSTRDYWHAWVNTHRFAFHGLSEDVVELFKRSVLLLRAHSDHEGGIIASADSDILQDGRDTYTYVWPRDGTFCAMALDATGHADISERFYRFCAEVLTDEGYLLHKYRPDRSLGSSWHAWINDGRPRLPIQEDETALTLVGLWQHYRIDRNIEFIEKLYNPYIKRAAAFMSSYRDRATGLPCPSHGLWEERYAVSCFTSASVYGALNAAASFAEVLGKREDADAFRLSARELRTAILERFYLPEAGHFAKLFERADGRLRRDDTLDASSAYGVFRFGVVEPDDARLAKAQEKTYEALVCTTPVGGLARYEGDAYYLVDVAFPGNPWFITTLWHIEYACARAQTKEDLAQVAEKLRVVAQRATGAGMLAEQLNPHTGEPVSATPLAWSHAGFVLAVVAYLTRLQELGICRTCYPLTQR